ncbi:MAG TPA: histidinol-phosphate transaminase [Paludibaculum sp.]|jgi:histidinol-phosphate/aromatic aminotransferase/cobyric acid decarboxylase-like protein
MSPAYHGGAFFEAIGVDLRHLERASEVISADVLDAWFDPSPRVVETLRQNLAFLLRTSPPNHAEGFVTEIAARRGVPEECILPGSGSSTLLFTCLPRLLKPGVRALALAPMYSEYEHIVEALLGGQVHHHELQVANGFVVDGDALLADVLRVEPDVVLLVNPCNPTGRLWPRADVLRFLDQVPATTLTIIDEAYLDYAGAAESLESEAARRPNLIVIKSMSKVYSLSGARVAYLVTEARRAAQLSPWLPPWPVGLLAQAAAMEALRDPSWYQERYAETHLLREQLRARLAALRPVESSVNFFLIEPPDPTALAAALRQRQIFVREFPDGPLAGRYLRVTVKDAAQNERMVSAILSVV